MASRGKDVHVQLSQLLNIPDTTDVVNYIESFQSKQDLEEYLYGLLDENDEIHRKFVDGYLNNWKPGVKSAKKPVIASSNVKTALLESPIELHRKSLERSVESAEEGEVTPKRNNRKSKTKYSPLFATQHGYSTAVVHLPGRYKCDCEATKHQLVNNCRNCGKIVCDQEGPGPCTFCGHIVRTKDDQEVVDRDSKSSEKLMKLLVSNKSQDKSEGLRKALEHKDKLLEFDQTVEKRTKIIDDQSDYYTLDNLWLTKEEREAIRKRNKDVESQKKSKENLVTFDFAGRKVVEERCTDQEQLQRQFELHMELLSSKENTLANAECNGQQLRRPIYDGSGRGPVLKGGGRGVSGSTGGGGMRLQGSELQEMNDQGWCLSLHQPYASLLVAGLKMHEGRTWYTAIRGRLWIASTTQQPTDGLIKKVEDSIRLFTQSEAVEFPVNYPVGALLGCVNLIDCLSQEEYREKFSVCESDSPFVFICSNPRQLLVKFPIRGQHKIYKLDTKIHDAAKKTLKAMEDRFN